MPVAPNLSLQVNMSSPVEYAYWTADDNTNDPYLGGPYQWQVQFDVTPQPHSSHTTTTPFYYTGNDMQIGDWFASGAEGKAMIVRSFVSQNDSTVVCIVEDYERYNLFTDPDQAAYGLAGQGPGVIFRLSEEGMPILGPVPDQYLFPKAVEDLMARFIARNGTNTFVLVNQHNHGFFIGDVICPDVTTLGSYKKPGVTDIQHAIGIVSETNVPGLDYFSYRPLGRLINNVNPPLFGQHGTIFYLDPNEPGALTMDRPDSNPVPIYMQLDLPTRAILLERGVEQVSAASSSTAKYDVTNVSTGQTHFTMPAAAKSVLYMAINGVENEDYTFDTNSKALVFDPVKAGYGVDVDDEVFFIYTT